MTELVSGVAQAKPYDLDDRYRSGSGPVLLTGVQAIARGFVEQHVRDIRAGKRIATFVSGYQGSPLGGVDKMLHGMPKVLAEHDITFIPGFNEELAATAVWGSQTDLPAGTATHDGVTGVWYGKGPGVDRATDTIRHANMYGVNPKGGVVLLVGDDPASKSSTVPAVSERSLAAMGVPVLFPRNAEEIITMGMHAVALSRVSGCVVALKIVADVADGAWTIDGSIADFDIVVPEVQFEGKPFVYKQRQMAAPPDSVIAEADLYGPRWDLVHAYGTANNLDVIEVNPSGAKIGIAATGTTFDSVRQALADLGVDDAALHRAGIRLLRIGMCYPVVGEKIKEFAEGLEQIVVVEDKTAFIEAQIREVLYGTDDAPRIIGKRDGQGRLLMPASGELTAGRLLAPLRRVLKPHVELKRTLPAPLSLNVLSAKRTAYFCSGCPHNRSTAIPEGSIGGGGIGCHTLVTMSGREDSAVTGLTQMGGEGSQWIGQAPFTDVPHLFQNIGDGTFFHSGQLAVQACIAAGVNITYKLLYNEVVAMTGAQDAEGALSVAQLSHKLTTEGVKQIIICADEPSRHNKRALAKGTKLWHRDRLDEAQKELREIKGVTVLIYDQHCAADARRQRKRGTLPTRNTRVVINEAVCEGCGDCGVKSNCLSVQPVDTEYGRKTKIDQTSCNTDYTCMDGDCPSFVTVELVPGKKAPKAARPVPPVVADPDFGPLTSTQNVFLAGIGGTGIVTVNQVLATAALRAGLEVESLDQIGLSQKAGPVVSHLRFSSSNLDYGNAEKTVSIASTSQTPTGDMVYDKAVRYPEETSLLARLDKVSRTLRSFDALAAAQELFGNTAAANFLLIGAAYQSGGLRLPAEAIEEAIGINGVAVDANIAAFRWGRAAIADTAAFSAVTTPAKSVREPVVAPAHMFAGTTFTGETLRLVELRAAQLIEFQSVKIAQRYIDQVQAVWTAERAATERTDFSEAVARGLFKFTAYKDEYEVARMLVDPAFIEDVKSQSHVALKVLAKGKKLRGTKLDPFGYMHVRKVERELLAEYEAMIADLSRTLATDGYDRAVEIAALPDVVRGYEDIKLGNIELYKTRLRELGVGE
eukprot:gene23883-28647_t